MNKTVTLHPSRIGCPSIPGTIKGIILSIPGVAEARVRYDDRSIDVSFDDQQTSAEEIIKTIGRETGLSMTVPGDAEGKTDVAETCPM